MKKKYKRALAVALATVMIWNTCDWHPQVLAGSSVQYIEEVKELSDEILHQEVPYGTKYKDLELPDKLKVRVLTEEASDEEDSAEDKDGAEKIATPSELQSGDGEVETEQRSQTLSSSETDGTVRKASPSEADVTEKSEIGGWMTLSRKHPHPMQTGRKPIKPGRKSRSVGGWMRHSVRKIHTMEKHLVFMCLMRN